MAKFFWACFGLLLYVYVLYPLGVQILAWLRFSQLLARERASVLRLPQ